MYQLISEVKQNLESAAVNSRFSEDQLEQVYTMAYQNIEQGQYEKALPLFNFLVMYRPTSKRYLMGLGVTQQMLQNYAFALRAFSFIGALHPDSPPAFLHIAQCYLSMGDVEKALEALQVLLDYCGATPGHEAIAKRAIGLQSLINTQVKNPTRK